jgi:hypothetical protein
VTGELVFQKALMQADRGDTSGAEATLRSLLSTTQAGALRVRAMIVLGDLLHTHDVHEARRVLTDALATIEQLGDTDDLLDAEVERARELLASQGRRR